MYGHTGHVRFLTCVEMTSPQSPTATTANKSFNEEEDTEEKQENLDIHSPHRRTSMAAATATMATRMLIISGGDGYEDFSRNNSSNEVAGRDDSTNHLLLWQV